MSMVYKICSPTEWAAAVAAGGLAGTADDVRDGYIHLSTRRQLPETLARHFAGRGDLIVAAFESAALGAELRFEPARGGELFPHLYAVLDPALAKGVWRLAADGAGRHLLPAELPA